MHLLLCLTIIRYNTEVNVLNARITDYPINIKLLSKFNINIIN